MILLCIHINLELVCRIAEISNSIIQTVRACMLSEDAKWKRWLTNDYLKTATCTPSDVSSMIFFNTFALRSSLVSFLAALASSCFLENKTMMCKNITSMSVCLFVCQSVHPRSVCLSVPPPVCLSVCMYVCMSYQ